MKNCKVYTPLILVKKILNQAGYFSNSILKKYIIEPASGEGIFLCEIVSRYIDEAISSGYSYPEIAAQLSTYIIGVELDSKAYEQSILNLNKLTERIGGEAVKWNVFNEDFLTIYTRYEGMMDYVVGNPPYIKVHDLENRDWLRKNFKYATGMFDLYICFFEAGIKMLGVDGTLAFISPNGWLKNSGYKKFRMDLCQNGLLSQVENFGTTKVFQGFSTYTAITVLSRNNDSMAYIEGDMFAVHQLKNLKEETKWNFHIDSENKTQAYIGNIIDTEGLNIQNGLATLKDNVFISKAIENPLNPFTMIFNGHIVEKSILKRIIKASKPEMDLYAIFPYKFEDGRYKAYSEMELSEFKHCYRYLLSNKVALQLRSINKNTLWYEYGRSQGIQTMHCKKIAISPLFRDKINVIEIPNDVLIYSGIFISYNPPDNGKMNILKDILESQMFLDYARGVGQDFSSGYKQLKSMDLKNFFQKKVVS